MSIGLGIGLGLRGGVSALPIVVPSFTDSSLLFMAPHATQALWVESGQESTPETHATAAGNLVGQIDDLSPKCNEFITATASRPTLAVDAAGGGCLTFASGKHLYANNSKYSFEAIHTTLIGTIAIRLTPTTDGVSGYILDACDAGGGNVGFLVRRETGNTITVGIAAAGSWRYLKTTTGTILAAGGTTTIIFTMDGTTGRVYLGAAAAETVAVGGAAIAAGTPQTNDLRIGARNNATPANFVGSIGTVVIDDVAWDTTQRAEFIAYNPVPTNASLVRKIASDGLPTDYTGLRMWLDAQGMTYLYQGLARTTAVTADGQEVRTWAVRAPANVNRDLTGSGAATTYPLYKPTLADDLGGVYFDGSNDNLVYNGPWPRAGDFHAFIVCQNDDADDGSHYWAGAAEYLAETGENYIGGAPSPYAVNHTAIGGASGTASIQNAGGRNVIEVKRTGGYCYLRVNGVGGYAIDAVLSGQLNNYGLMGNIGHADAAWQLHGLVFEFALYTNALPVAYANAVVQHMGLAWFVDNLGV